MKKTFYAGSIFVIVLGLSYLSNAIGYRSGVIDGYKFGLSGELNEISMHVIWLKTIKRNGLTAQDLSNRVENHLDSAVLGLNLKYQILNDFKNNNLLPEYFVGIGRNIMQTQAGKLLKDIKQLEYRVDLITSAGNHQM